MSASSNPAQVLDFRRAQESLKLSLRAAMLEAANQLLMEHGVAALTVRRVAEAVNCSTTLLYSIFGGKDGLSNALYLHGFSLFQQQLEALEASLPEQAALAGLDKLQLYASSYRDFAHRYRSYYLIMFGDALAGFVPSADSREIALAAFLPLVRECQRCMDHGVLPGASPTAAARLLWAAMHGVISLEFKDFYLNSQQADQLYRSAVRAALMALQQPGKELS